MNKDKKLDGRIVRYLHNILKEYSGEVHPDQPVRDEQL